MGNKEYWDEKFEKRSDKLLSPEKSVVKNLKHFKVGSVLDIACGDGRNTIFLIENGFKVTGIDFSNEALLRLKMFAQRSNLSVETKQVDLSEDDALKDLGVYDNILINHYRMDKKQLIGIEEHITDNGILFICGFGDKHKVDSKIRAEDLIQPDDFEDIRNAFDLLKYDETQDDIGFFVTYVFRKKDSRGIES